MASQHGAADVPRHVEGGEGLVRIGAEDLGPCTALVFVERLENFGGHLLGEEAVRALGMVAVRAQGTGLVLHLDHDDEARIESIR